jgi:cyclophilin family peptidyl-prolyl cis-trans isomerase
MRLVPLLLASFLVTAAQAQDTTPPPDAATPAPQAPAQPAPVAGPKVLISTSMGDITLQLDQQHAPLTVANFVRYAREHHFDGTLIYRVVPGILIQGGSWDGPAHARPVHKPIPLEANNGLKNVRGAIAMAHGDPNSATAEYFIDLIDAPSLDQLPTDTANSTGFAVFGNVVDGLDVLDRIGHVAVGDNGPMKGQAPVDPIKVIKVQVLPNAAQAAQ